MTYQLAPIIIWASVEVNLVTISSKLTPSHCLMYVILIANWTACLPIIRPACLYLFTCTNPASTIDSQSNEYRRNYPRSHQTKHSIRLGTIPKDGSSSTQQLTELEPSASDASMASVAESESYRRHGHTASVTLPSPSIAAAYTGVGRIMVKNETIVHVSDSRSPCWIMWSFY